MKNSKLIYIVSYYYIPNKKNIYQEIYKIFRWDLLHLASKSVIVMVFLSDMGVGKVLLLSGVEAVKKPGSLGSGRIAPSVPNMKSTDDITGLSSAYL